MAIRGWTESDRLELKTCSEALDANTSNISYPPDEGGKRPRGSHSYNLDIKGDESPAPSVRILLGNVEIVVGRSVGTIESCKKVSCQRLEEGLVIERTLPIISVGAVLATIPVIPIPVILDVTVTVTECLVNKAVPHLILFR